MTEQEIMEIVKAKREPIRDCEDMSRRLIGSKGGYVYLSERFRFDFDKRMIELSCKKEECEQLKLQLAAAENYSDSWFNRLQDKQEEHYAEKLKLENKIDELVTMLAEERGVDENELRELVYKDLYEN